MKHDSTKDPSIYETANASGSDTMIGLISQAHRQRVSAYDVNCATTTAHANPAVIKVVRQGWCNNRSELTGRNTSRQPNSADSVVPACMAAIQVSLLRGWRHPQIPITLDEVLPLQHVLFAAERQFASPSL
jgi:hypothetical protein